MTVLVYGYIGDPNSQAKKFLDVNQVQLVPGGWGQFLYIDSNSKLFIANYESLKKIDQAEDQQVLCGCSNQKKAAIVSQNFQILEINIGDKWEEINVAPIHPMSGRSVQQVALGEEHCLGLLLQGGVIAWGSNAEGQLAQSQTTFCHHPVAIDFEENQTLFKQVFAGSRSSGSLNAKGEVFCWGWNLHCQCGQPMSPTVSKPQRIDKLVGIPCVHCSVGLAHTAAITDSGDVYVWGWNEDGQVGNNSTQSCWIPCLVEDEEMDKEVAKQIACGARHTVVLCENGSVFGWGWNKYGQLGSQTQSQQLTPVSMPTTPHYKVESISCGWWHTVLQESDAQ